jgi:hypothetical protein
MMAALQNDVSALFEEAVKSFDTAVRSGVKIQQDLTKVWTDALAKFDPTKGIDARTHALIDDAFPTAQKSVEECLKLIDKASQSSMDLLKKAMTAGAVQSLPEAKARTQEIWEASLAALRTNAQAMVDANSRVLDAWVQLGDKAVAAARSAKPAAAK